MPKRARARDDNGGEQRNQHERASGASCASEADASTAALLLQQVYESMDGYAIAREAKRKQRAAGVFLDGIQYGEVCPRAFAAALSWCAPASGETFIDCGSGTGKAVLAAAALHPLAKATGVEILQPLHDTAERAHARWLAIGSPFKAATVTFECGDALAHSWTAYDLVFFSLTCFTDDMVERVAQDAHHLKVGARLLVTSRTLDSSSLRLLRKETLSYGRGTMTFIAYERI